jgi:hypothetical protein
MAEEIKTMIKIHTPKLATVVIRSQQFLSVTTAIAMVLAMTIIHYVIKTSLLDLWPILLGSLVVVVSNIRNIKKPHITAFSIECIAICLILANIAYGNHLLEIYKGRENVALLTMQRFYQAEAQQEFAVILDAFKLAWFEVTLVGLFYALRIKVLFNNKKVLAS